MDQDDMGLYATPSRHREYEQDDYEYGREEFEQDNEFALANDDEDPDVDDEVDVDDDGMDGVILPSTPSRTGRTVGGRGLSTPTMTPGGNRKRKPINGTPASARKNANNKPTQRKSIHDTQVEWLQKMLDPDAEGYVRPTAADAYFVAAGRPKRKRVEVSEVQQQGAQGAGCHQAETGPGTLIKTPDRADIAAKLKLTRRQDLETWDRILRAGNNLICYGYGSKSDLLSEYADTRLRHQGHVMVAHGMYPGLTIKDVLIEIEEMFPQIRRTPVPEQQGLTRAIDKLGYRIYCYFLPPSSKPPFEVANKPLYLVLNNIDAPGLRTERSLALLSLLASSPRIHLVTSFDHVHTPILFSTTQNVTPKHSYNDTTWNGTVPASRGFNWAWLDATTYAPYDLELQYVQQAAAISGKSVLGLKGSGDDDPTHGHGGDITEEGLLRVLQSVPPMARRLFKLLALRQLSALPQGWDPDQACSLANAQSAPVFAIDSEILQKLAKDKFIAREEERYNAQLTEYRDHNAIVEHSVDSDGNTGRWLWIPLSENVLQRVLTTMEDVDA